MNCGKEARDRIKYKVQVKIIGTFVLRTGRLQQIRRAQELRSQSCSRSAPPPSAGSPSSAFRSRCWQRRSSLRYPGRRHTGERSEATLLDVSVAHWMKQYARYVAYICLGSAGNDRQPGCGVHGRWIAVGTRKDLP